MVESSPNALSANANATSVTSSGESLPPQPSTGAQDVSPSTMDDVHAASAHNASGHVYATRQGASDVTETSSASNAETQIGVQNVSVSSHAGLFE